MTKIHLDNDSSQYLWTEKYRPKKIDDCVLPKSLKKLLSNIVKGGEVPNLILSGGPGQGKTTAAKAICNELGYEYILINASEENGIDVLRNKIRKFASSVSLGGDRHKVVILDEADYLPAHTVQVSLRGFMEEFSRSARFILTCNLKNRIIDPLHSRCTTIDFDTEIKDLSVLASEFFKRMSTILKQEGVSYQDEVLAKLIIRDAPDWRRILNACQRYAITNENVIDSTILLSLDDSTFDALFGYLKSKDFKSMRGWVANHTSIDSNAIFRKIYDRAADVVDSSSIPNLVLILADYGYKSAFVADKEINTAACLTELMCNLKWKS